MERESREISWPAVLVVASAVAVTALCGYLLASWPPEPPPVPAAAMAPAPTSTPPPSSSPSASSSPAAAEQPVLAVLGDSFSVPAADSGASVWPELLGGALEWTVVSDAVDGSGYVTPGEGRPFRQRAQDLLRESPDVLILAGGYHDVRSTGVPEVSRAANQLVSRLVAKAPESEIVLVSPFSGIAPEPITLQLSAGLRRVAERHDVVYVDATRWLSPGGDLMTADGVHPTRQGQRRLAMRMEQALNRQGLVGTAALRSAPSDSGPS